MEIMVIDFHSTIHNKRRFVVLIAVVIITLCGESFVSTTSRMLQIQTLTTTTARRTMSTQQYYSTTTKSNSTTSTTSTTTTTTEIVGEIRDNRVQRLSSQPQSTNATQHVQQQQQQQYVVNKDLITKERKLVYMHVGKTGGTTIGSTFWERCRTIPHQRKLGKYQKKRLYENCWSKIHQSGITNETNLSKIMKSWVHYPTTNTTKSKSKSKYTLDQGGFTDVLFPIREPISRFISWYGQEQRQRQQRQRQKQQRQRQQRQKQKQKKRNNDDDDDDFYNRFFVNCFPTIPHLVNALIPPKNKTATTTTNNNVTTTTSEEKENNNCTILIREAFNSIGTHTQYGHLAAGYRFYTSLVSMEKQTIWSVRTEYLWDDMKNIDIALGGNGYYGTNLDAYKVTHGSEEQQYYNKSTSSSNSISSSTNDTNTNTNNNMIYLCCALWPEYQAYRNIIEHSTNINSDDQKLETYKLSWSKCNNVTNWDDFETRCTNLDSVLS